MHHRTPDKRPVFHDSGGATGSTTSPTREGDAPESARAHSLAPRPGLVALFPREREGTPGTWILTKQVEVGRSRHLAMRLDDERVSRIHATIEARGGGVFVLDRESRHGSY